MNASVPGVILEIPCFVFRYRHARKNDSECQRKSYRESVLNYDRVVRDSLLLPAGLDVAFAAASRDEFDLKRYETHIKAPIQVFSVSLTGRAIWF